MFTKCPKCQSVFMVSDKDIKAHEGLVRCGNCYSVFNSSWNLTDDPRSDIEESRVSDDDLAVTQGSGFTFSILGHDSDASVDSENLPNHSEGLSEPEANESKTSDEDRGQPDDFLEPFPQPEAEDELKPVPVAADKKNDESLLYFDSDEEAGNKADVLENASDMQMPSFTDDEDLVDLDDPQLEPDVSESESALLSMTEDSMWPGSDVNFNDIGGNFDLPVLDDEISEAESGTSDASETLPDLPDILLDKPDVEADFVEGLNDPLHFNESAGNDEGTLPELDEEAFIDEISGEETGVEDTAMVEPFLPALDAESDVAEFEQDDVSGNQVITDDTLITDEQIAEEDEQDEQVSVESPPESADVAIAPDADEEGESDTDSVFITSQEEELDDAYVPITVKHDERDELFHGLDDFPEPGDLSKLNYEDTMEINAMLEAANVSKEQIDSALSSSERDDDDNIVEEIMLSSDPDLSDSIHIKHEEDEAQSGDDSGSNKKSRSGGSLLKNLLPLGWGDKKPLSEPSVLGPDETQLIQNLNRSKKRIELPEWITKYSLIAANVILVLALMGQIGYFYMDKLARITPVRPLLEVSCKIAGCTVPSIQNIEDIQQLSSRLTPLAGGDGGFKVDSILVNRGIRSQGFPALELTLTDRAGNMISRRVVTADNYLPAGRSQEMKPNAAVDVSIRFNTPSIRVDGFELRPVSQNWLERN